MPPVVKDVLVQRPPAQVFSALVEPRERAAWSTTFEEQPLAGPMRVGARIQAKRRGSTSGSRYELEVTALEPGRRLAMRVHRNGKPVASGAFDLEPVDGGSATRVRSVSALELAGLQRMMEPVLAAAAAKELDAELASLKRHVESRPAQA